MDISAKFCDNLQTEQELKTKQNAVMFEKSNSTINLIDLLVRSSSALQDDYTSMK